MKSIYLDHAATTPLRPEALEVMLPFLTGSYGNPSSIHQFGRDARRGLEQGRESIAANLGVDPKELTFTGGGSESDNMAIIGLARAKAEKGKHIITSAIEHHAVYDTFKYLEAEGFQVTYLPVDQRGRVSPQDLQEALREETILVSIMHANNEIGTVQPIKELAGIAHDRGALFHTDAVQTVGTIPVDVRDLGVDALSFSAHKFYGPKGVGGLYLRRGLRIKPLIHGGAQERGKRAGTENVAGIVGMARALELGIAEMGEAIPRVIGLRDTLIKGLLERIPETILNGDPQNRLPGNANLCFKYVEGESLLLNLDMEGIAASSGSACTSGSLDPSHVLLAIGLPHEIAHGSVRFSLGTGTTQEEIDHVLEVFPGIVGRLRAMSPIYPGK